MYLYQGVLSVPGTSLLFCIHGNHEPKLEVMFVEIDSQNLNPKLSHLSSDNSENLDKISFLLNSNIPQARKCDTPKPNKQMKPQIRSCYQR